MWFLIENYFISLQSLCIWTIVLSGGVKHSRKHLWRFLNELADPLPASKSRGEGKKSILKMDRWQQQIPMVFFCISARDFMSPFLEVTVSSTISWFTYSSWMVLFSWALNALLVRQKYQMWFCSCSLVEVIVILSPTWMRWESETTLLSCIPIYFS